MHLGKNREKVLLIFNFPCYFSFFFLNFLRIAIDPIFGFPPHPDWSLSAKKTFIPDSIMDNSKFELVFDELFDVPAL